MNVIFNYGGIFFSFYIITWKGGLVFLPTNMIGVDEMLMTVSIIDGGLEKTFVPTEEK